MPKVYPIQATHIASNDDYPSFVSNYSDDEIAKIQAESNNIPANNYLRLIFPGLFEGLSKEEWQNKESIKNEVDQLLRNDILVKDSASSFYIYQQKEKDFSCIGIICLVATEAYVDNQVKKHELTLSEKEKGIAQYFRNTRINGNPVLLTYPNQKEIDDLIDEYTAGNSADYSFTCSKGIHHNLWKMKGDEIQSYLTDIESFYIADGHHRCASFSHLQNETYGFMAYLVPVNDLRILPFHRQLFVDEIIPLDDLISKLSNDFVVTREEAAFFPTQLGEICVFHPDGLLHLRIREEKTQSLTHKEVLDVSLLESKILQPIFGINDSRTNKALRFLPGNNTLDYFIRRFEKYKSESLMFLLHPISMEVVIAISDDNETLPPKSTWVEPKIPSGILLHQF